MNIQEKHYRVLLGVLCPVLILFGTAMSAPRPIERPLIQAETTSLVVTPSVTGRPGEAVSIEVTLSTAFGAPVAESEVVLRSTFGLALNARTDALGNAAFLLPPDMPEGDHTLRLVFAGGDGHAPAIAVTMLHFHAEAPADASAVEPVGAMMPADGPLADAGAAAAPGQEDQAAPATGHATRLIVQPELRARPGELAVVGAQLTTLDGEAVAGAELVLTADGVPDVRAQTGANGIAAFQLPGDLASGDYNLRIVFPGDENFRPSIALTTLHYHVQTPGSSSEQPALSPVATPPPAPVLPGPVTSAPVAGRYAIAKQPGLSHPIPLTMHVADLRLPAATDVPAALTQAPVLALQLGTAAASIPGAPWLALLASILVVGIAMAPALMRRPAWSWPRMSPIALPAWFWNAMRIISIGTALGLAVVLFVRPEVGLFFFWRVMIPMVPLLFFVAPALWRNICPMAALNQTPRRFGFTKGMTPPQWMQRYGYLIAIGLFLVLVSTRKVLFNTNGPALAVLILVALTAAFVMGDLFRGKSGWCSSICPLLPVQRIYGQTPFVNVTHAHCEPCLGCTKNCYDLNPKNAYLADLYDDDRRFALFRRAFVGLFPGFILAFYLVPNPPAIPVWQMYAMLAAAGVFSMLTFFAVEAVTRHTGSKITVLYGALALNLYYWFNAVTLGSLIAAPAPEAFVWSLRTLVLALTLFWVYRTYQKEKPFIELTLAPASLHGTLSLHGTTAARKPANGKPGNDDSGAAKRATPVVTVAPDGQQIAVQKNRTLLEICEQHNLPIESGCRMGLCGADPVCVLKGMENLSKVGDDERTTLERLGMAPNTRMACMARVRGDVEVALTPDKPDIYQSSIVPGFKYDKGVERVVIVGNGIAGVTAADHIRRRHPHCEIHLIGRERHHLYNRMGITRLIYGRSAMQGLYLLPEQWYEDFNITCWLNTHVTHVDRDARTVALGTGETLPYDRLILTTGSQSFVPPIDGYGMPGTFVLRSAEDAMTIRAYVQEQGSRTAVVAGGGLLGLEAAYGLYKLGLEVTVLERSPALLARQLDARSSEFLLAYLEGLGIRVRTEAEVAAAHAADGAAGARVATVTLGDGQVLPCDLLLVAAGIRADLELARQMGLELQQGVVVDDLMRTSDPHIFAAGDVAEYGGKLYGLWPVAVSQAEVAAANAVAENGIATASYVETAPVTMLKVVGIDITSIGRIAVEAGDTVIALEESARHHYRKLIIRDGKIAGAILLGYPLEAPGVAAAVKQELDITPLLDDLRRGDWDELAALA
ncbi:MAG: FAD-dependent oxidoreductase [Caldilinea sp.]|nr:FAD-dependent oxidoreductase [Caldilinea sp.]